MDRPSLDNENINLFTLQEVFRVVGDQLNARDVRVLKFMFSGIFTPEFLSQINDGFSFLQALEKIDRIDESNFKTLENYLRIINRHDLFQFLTLRRRKTVRTDPVNEYLEQSATSRDGLNVTKCRHKCDSCDRAFSKNTTTSNTISPTPVYPGTVSSEAAPSSTDGAGSTKSGGQRTTNGESSSGEQSVPGKVVIENQTSTRQSMGCETASSQPSADLPYAATLPTGSDHSNHSSANECPPDSSNGKHRLDKDESIPGPSKRHCAGEGLDSPSQPDCSTPKCATDSNTRHSAGENSRGKNSGKRIHKLLGQAPARRSERLRKRSLIGSNQSNSVNVVTGLERAAIASTPESTANNTIMGDDIKKKITCDIRLRVRAEYCSHESALQGNVHSNKAEQIERQFEKFMQANTILRSRDLGSIICDIKFSELTYLDAFWRDYINGSLLEALKGVFITEPLKQAVGHEAIKLIVNVDEDDYESGRLVLLRNLQQPIS